MTPLDDEALFRLIAERAERELDPDDPRNARYFEWRAREARERQTPEERAETEAMATAFARRWRERHLAESLRVLLASGAVPIARVPEDASPNAPLRECVRLGRRAGRLPFVDGRVAAGVGGAIWDEPCRGWLSRPRQLSAGDYVALTITGDSMTPLLHDGDTVVLDVGCEPLRGSVVVARLPDDGFVVKRLAGVDDSFVELQSLNEAYAPLTLMRDEVEIVGTVVLRWCGHQD